MKLNQNDVFSQAIGTSTYIEPFKTALLPSISLCLYNNHAPSFKPHEANQTLPIVGKADLTQSNYGDIGYFNGDERHV